MEKLPSTSKLDGGHDKPIPLQMRLWFGMAAVKPIAHVQRGLDACLSMLVGWEPRNVFGSLSESTGWNEPKSNWTVR